MATTPPQTAAVNGLPTALQADNQSAQVNQFLGTPGSEIIYTGNQILTPEGGAQFTWLTFLTATDVDQPFTLSGTTVGRVTLPINPVGNGANLLVTLYPDNGSGKPNLAAPITGTLLTADEINQLAAPDGLTNAGPLANELNNTGLFTGGITSTPWTAPASGSGSTTTLSSCAVDQNFFVSVGGNDPTDDSPISAVVTIQYQGNGQIALPTPQTALPIPTSLAGVAICADCVIVVGGAVIGGSGTTNNVYVASWDGVNGVVGSWSAQEPYPISLYGNSSVGYGDNVYVVGGLSTGVNAFNNVYMGNVGNGQINSWVPLTPYPFAVTNTKLVALNGWLVAVGGDDINFDSSSLTYFAKINPVDGTIGNWLAGPNLPEANNAFGTGLNTCVAGDMVVILMDGNFPPLSYSLAVTEDGVGPSWQLFSWLTNGPAQVGAFSTGSGSYDVIAIHVNQDAYEFSTMLSVPMISVPLYASGLTSGHVYHVVMQQFQSKSASDYLQIGVNTVGDNGDPVLPIDALTAPRHSTTWTTYDTTWAVPMSVFDASATGPIRHVWTDPNSTGLAEQTLTLLKGSGGQLTGLVEATRTPNSVLNSNPTFTTGTSPWTVVNGTFTQSNAQTQGGFAFSGLLTPTGGNALAYVDSELIPLTQTPYAGQQWVYVNGWFYSPTGTTNFSLQTNWFDSSQAYLSTDANGATPLTANTWTQISQFFKVPALAAFGAINPVEAGTPTSANTIYMSNVTMVLAPETVPSLAGAVQLDYGTTGVYPPAEIIQLV